ncbi:hypothetical protein [Microbacterium sp. MYb45]|uniref:hypothetical protein n=1 Tax=Microbacterium sp. MYb45 TaxID=1827294 RepID=UPI000CFED2A2|nr:hypothetical protein [Microbacterium sp. MYb45]PRB59010.1 hypothetical protein CQ034_15785 [Microbacterium sp. MYb45]
MADGDDEDLLVEIATTDKYRARSNSVAALTAAAAGALAAALALNPALVAFPFATRVLAMTSVVFLVVATGAFVVGSVLHARATAATKAGRAANKFLRPWEALFERKESGPDAEEYRRSIESVQRQIMRATDVGMWLAAGAILTIIAALISMLLINEQREVLVFSLSDTSPARALCPSLPEMFEATTKTVELRSLDDALTLQVTSDLCGLGASEGLIEFTVARTDVLVIRPVAG